MLVWDAESGRKKRLPVSTAPPLFPSTLQLAGRFGSVVLFLNKDPAAPQIK